MDLEAITRQGGRAALVMVTLWLSITAALSDDTALTPLAELGKRVFFDETLSATGTQSCASCHAPDVGFSGPNERFNRMGAYEGAVHGEFGKRKPQTAAYVGLSPVLHIEMMGGVASFVGGSFWDGRATGLRLKDPLAEQALGPLLNPVEQALPSSACVVQRACAGSYASLYGKVSPSTCEIAGLASLRCRDGQPADLDPTARALIAAGFDTIARAVDDYEESPQVSVPTVRNTTPGKPARRSCRRRSSPALPSSPAKASALAAILIGRPRWAPRRCSPT